MSAPYNVATVNIPNSSRISPERVREGVNQLSIITRDYLQSGGRVLELPDDYTHNFEELPSNQFSWPYSRTFGTYSWMLSQGVNIRQDRVTHERDHNNRTSSTRTLRILHPGTPLKLHHLGEAEPLIIPQPIEDYVDITTNSYYTQFTRRDPIQSVTNIVILEYAYFPRFQIVNTFGLEDTTSITGQFVDIGQFQEVNPQVYIEWENKVASDLEYARMQLRAQEVLEEYCNVNMIYLEHGRIITSQEQIATGLTIPPTREDPKTIEDFLSPMYCIAANTPKRRSEFLLKEWLSDEEYIALTSRGELELPSQYEKDVIYIIKRDATERVKIKKDGKIEEELCIIPTDHSLPNADNLLTKILLLKADEKEFLNRSNRYAVHKRGNSYFNSSIPNTSNWYISNNTNTTIWTQPVQAISGAVSQYMQLQISANTAASTTVVSQYQLVTQ